MRSSRAAAPAPGGATRADHPSVAGDPGAAERLSSSLTVLVVVLLVSAGAVLRFAGIGDKSLWIDEAFSVWVARQPFEDLLRTTVDLDFHPPFYYSALRVWLALGDGEAALRSFSALLSVLTLPVVFFIGRHLGGRALGLLSMALIAVSPLNIAYAQQARMYALTTLCAAVSLLCALVLLHGSGDARPAAAGQLGPGRPWRARLWWAAFVVSTTLTMLSHNTAVLAWVAIAVFVALAVARPAARDRQADGSPGRGFRRHPLQGVAGVATGLLAAAVLWLPWLPHFVSQSRRVDEEFWLAPPTMSTVLGHWHDLANAYAPEGGYRNYVLLGAGVLVVLGVSNLWNRGEAVLLLLLLVLVPVAVELLVSLRRPIFYSQTLIWTSVPFTVLLAAGILRLRVRALVAAVAVVAVALNLVAVGSYYRDGGREDWRAAVRYAAAHLHSGDLVLFSAAWSQIPFDYYYESSAGPRIVQHGLPTDVSVTRVLEAKMTPADLSRLDELTMDRSTVWLVSSHDWYTDPHGFVPARLSSSFSAAEVRPFPGITVTHYRADGE